MDTKQEPSFDQDLSTIVAQLPVPVRKFFASGKIEIVAKSLMQKNKLHIDQCAIVEREMILLLLGLKSPDEFTKSLAEEARLDQQTISGIVRDLNEQIFVPLREELRRLAGSESRPLAPATSSGQASGMRKGPTAQMGRNEPLRSVLVSITKETKLLEDHEEPHIEFKKVPAPPPANLPGAIYHPPLPPKPYSADPYREPIDEK